MQRLQWVKKRKAERGVRSVEVGIQELHQVRRRAKEGCEGDGATERLMGLHVLPTSLSFRSFLTLSAPHLLCRMDRLTDTGSVSKRLQQQQSIATPKSTSS